MINHKNQQLKNVKKDKKYLLKGKIISSDMQQHTIKIDESLINFSASEYEIFILLLESNGKSIGRNYILDQVWGRKNRIVSESSVPTAISNIRKKLGSVWDCAIIETLTHEGYTIKDVKLMGNISSEIPLRFFNSINSISTVKTHIFLILSILFSIYIILCLIKSTGCDIYFSGTYTSHEFKGRCNNSVIQIDIQDISNKNLYSWSGIYIAPLFSIYSYMLIIDVDVILKKIDISDASFRSGELIRFRFEGEKVEIDIQESALSKKIHVVANYKGKSDVFL